MRFVFQRLEIPDVVLVTAGVFADHRGTFVEQYRQSAFAAAGIPDAFVQDNLSSSRQGVLRGLHYQKPPRAQGKLVAVLRGEIFDVAVDIRRGSPTYGRWVGVVLSAATRTMLYIPPGFAHGFCVLSPEADVFYKVTAEYAPDLDRGIVWNDPDLAIAWPVAEPVLSARDAALPRLCQAGDDFHYGDPSGDAP
jgi:dTDP-4-dehydrorhamnose 3,5-epimerase